MKRNKKALKNRQEIKKIHLTAILSILSGKCLCKNKDMTPVNAAIEHITNEPVDDKSIKMLRRISSCYLQYSYPELRGGVIDELEKELEKKHAQKSYQKLTQKTKDKHNAKILEEFLAKCHRKGKMQKQYNVRKLSAASYKSIITYIAKSMQEEGSQ